MKQGLNKPIRIENIDPFFLEYLSDIGIKSEEEIEGFLFPQLSHLPDPFTMDHMTEASELVSEWIIKKRPVLLWGDYDVDGITGSSILFSFLQQVGCDVYSHIPDRVHEGYGVNKDKIEEFSTLFKERNCLLITVDCGMSNRDEVDFAHKEGFKVIVTDHHEPGDSVPSGCCILNGKKHNCSFQEHQLSGVGTVFFLLIAVRKKLVEKNFFLQKESIPNLKQFLALTALGTVADMVPMTRTNRILVKAGFEVLSMQYNNMKGINALLAAMDLENGVHCVDEISFKIAPVINAAGRIGDAKKAFELFTTDNAEMVDDIVNYLISLNEKRKDISKKDFELSLRNISTAEVEQDKCIVIFGKFNQGLTGIIASRLVEKFAVPAIVFAEIEGDNERLLKGSARSVDGVDILYLIDYASKFTLKFGGHQGAAGISMMKQHFEAFRLMVCDGIKNGFGRIPKKNKLRPYEISIDQAFSDTFLKCLSLLEPTGEGIPKPEFVDMNARVVYCKQVGQENEHLQMVFRGQLKNHRGVGFFQGHQFNIVNQGEKFTLVYTPYLNKFNKVESWQVMVSSITQQ